ncbi:RNA polymerase sigma factor [Cellulomonas shaoxiangyii]|uniref:Sigma-70 family RNA polymerase sigma factor n=1 Tax=Cellulomonas shaoxiangyii TaxID=2566013 RepID=A0A4P7SKL3_9CELL|nr:sigma-70 family RNA polymerase sigma factor [Cellulomonas shaoxiangyii]QCB94742.1 sigma-70 family RNA polymerase sigma factor [Cellulomonas shaoxiangyii]TGY86472.1 sigma-70 family RNA polymerase sigma factor [Cellulomonas shaoxiangyii]
MELMSRDLPRDDRWFEAMFVEHGNKVLAYARRRVPDEADDVVAEVFATAWKYRDRVPPEPLPWLYRTAAHQILHSHRSSSRRTALVARTARLDEPERHPTDVAEHLVERLDREALVARVMTNLSPRDQEVLRLWAWEELSTDEIAYVLVISSTAARVRLHRARRRAEAVLRDASPPARLPLTLRSVVEEIR